MCNVLKISRAAYYKHLHRKPSRYEQENKALDQEIINEYTASKRRYGAPKIHKILENKGIFVSLKVSVKDFTPSGSRLPLLEF